MLHAVSFQSKHHVPFFVCRHDNTCPTIKFWNGCMLHIYKIHFSSRRPTLFALNLKLMGTSRVQLWINIKMKFQTKRDWKVWNIEIQVLCFCSCCVSDHRSSFTHLWFAALEKAVKEIAGSMTAIVSRLVEKYKQDEKKLQRLDQLQQQDTGTLQMMHAIFKHVSWV